MRIRPDDFSFDAAGSDSLLFFGRIRPGKGPREAISVARCAGPQPNMYGIVLNQDYHEREVVSYIDDAVRDHGVVGGEERVRGSDCARALLHPINFEEPFGLSVIEAMPSGTLVIASRRGSMPQLIEHEVNGFLVDTKSVAVEAVHKIDAINRTHVRETILARFAIDRIADEYLSLYPQIFGVSQRLFGRLPSPGHCPCDLSAGRDFPRFPVGEVIAATIPVNGAGGARGSTD